ncbi:MAG TPA: metalloregulator ArsR/SmtB family transcription factor [archaeon]|nr:metalloregulator ArsR/SmtB family transcription factor [archaeon]HLD80668.1 metalloregulator ArsR/SmtB family transcription factor [archaeon]
MGGSKELYGLHAEMCKVFSSPARLEILGVLRGRELTVGELVKLTGLSQANVSQHLSLMKAKGVVVAKRAGKHVCYRLANRKLIKAFDLIREVLAERLKAGHEAMK